MKIKYILYFLLLLILILVVKTCYDAGSFKTINPHLNGEIVDVYNSLAGTEDIDLDAASGLLFVSSANRRTDDTSSDGIYVLDLNKQDSKPRKLITTFSGDFHPHGISVLRKDSLLYLHAVNHNKEGDFIEMFEYRNDVLTHLSSVSSEMMCCPNDVVATGKFMCYITNDHGSPSGIKRTMEDYLKIPNSYILYYNGTTFSKVHTGLNYANGINVSPEGSYLYATHTTGQQLLTFDIKIDGSLELLDEMDLDSGVDNIDIDSEGNIWIGCHPKLFDFVAHSRNSYNTSPSQVLKIIPGQHQHIDYTVEEPFLDDGKIISGSSVAVQHNKELFIGVVFDHKLLRIRLN